MSERFLNQVFLLSWKMLISLTIVKFANNSSKKLVLNSRYIYLLPLLTHTHTLSDFEFS